MYSKSWPLPLSHLGRNVVLNNAKSCEQKSELGLSVIVCSDDITKLQEIKKEPGRKISELRNLRSGVTLWIFLSALTCCCRVLQKVKSFKNQRTFLNSHLGAFQLASQPLLRSWATWLSLATGAVNSSEYSSAENLGAVSSSEYGGPGFVQGWNFEKLGPCTWGCSCL